MTAEITSENKHDVEISKKEKNLILIGAARNGDKAAFDELVESNLGLVKKIALHFRDRGTDYDDLIQIGTIGMIKAIQSFDFSLGTAFSTYAVPLIIGEIRRHMRDDGLIKVSRPIKKNGITVLKASEKFISEFGREPKISELSEICLLSESDVAIALEAVGSVYSFNASTDDDDGLTLEGTIADSEDFIGSTIDRIALSEAISKLEPLHRKIITLRYFKNLSQCETGKILGLTQVKISREEKKLLEKLRREL